jgi:FlaG/FlaF family flagellin (archaellin)
MSIRARWVYVAIAVVLAILVISVLLGSFDSFSSGSSN